MGCGASNTLQRTVEDAVDRTGNKRGHGEPAAAKSASETDDRPSSDRSSRQSGRGQEKGDHERALLKVQSKLGQKAIENSFVVQKQRNKNRRRDTDSGMNGNSMFGAAGGTISFKIEADEFAVKAGAPSFLLPAENAAVEGMNVGVTTSGPSFKMMRPGAAAQRAAVLRQIKEGGDRPSNNSLKVRSSNSDVAKQIVSEEDYKGMLYSTDVQVVIRAVSHYREQLSTPNPPIAAVRREGVVPRLVQLLDMDSTNRKLQYEVVWTLTNICSAEHDDCQDVVDQGAVPRFIGLLQSCDDLEVLEQVIWALGNIAADSPDLQKVTLEEGIVEPLMKCMNANMDKLPFLRHAAWLLSNLCRPRPQSEELYSAVKVIANVLERWDDAEVSTHVLWALAYISGEEDALNDVMGIAPILRKLIDWVGQASSSMTTPSLRTLGNLCSGTNEATQMVVEGGGIPAILSCLKATQREAIKKECIWSMSNVAAGTSAQVAELAAAGCFATAICVMNETEEEALKRECAFMLANPWTVAVKASAPLAQTLLKQGVVAALMGLLQESEPERLVMVALEGLQDAVKKGQQVSLFISNGAAALNETTDMFANGVNPVVEQLKAGNILTTLHVLKKKYSSNEVLTTKLTTLENSADFH